MAPSQLLVKISGVLAGKPRSESEGPKEGVESRRQASGIRHQEGRNGLAEGSGRSERECEAYGHRRATKMAKYLCTED